MEQFRRYAVQRVIVGILFAVIALWIITFVVGFFKGPVPTEPGKALLQADKAPPVAHEELTHPSPDVSAHQSEPSKINDSHGGQAQDSPLGNLLEKQRAPVVTALPGAGHNEVPLPVAPDQARGVAFITATMQSLDYELNKRFWGWRPNDILDFTDNVNNYQLGVLEVTRRTVVVLAERISRKGANDAFNKNVENAMNWLMIKADSYWFPSPESKYEDAIDELNVYLSMLKQGEASFYTRQDSLIPLLQVFEDLMGSCEENLVKTHEKDGKEVSHFMADDYFFYAKGVASAMIPILEAVVVDFVSTVETRRGSELLETIITECHHARHIDPLYITNADFSGILANHRANLAARISGARYYLGLLIKTLST
ncbi:MAG: DUF2333 family protein [Candidatus Cloacimonadaceae bacterium]|jgi:hypothetical protein|nr:DUF2333 family protein [Candidatus Cloacimonadaceae bacterium]